MNQPTNEYITPAMLKTALLERDDVEVLRLLKIVCEREGQSNYHTVKYSHDECNQVAERLLSEIKWQYVHTINNAYRFFRTAARHNFPKKVVR